MYGTNGTGSVLGASATVVGSTAGTVVLAHSHAAAYVKAIAGASYVLLLAVLVSFIAKSIVLKRASKR